MTAEVREGEDYVEKNIIEIPCVGLHEKVENKVETVPIQFKLTLTIKEAAEYSNIGINKLESLLRSPLCPFVLYVGKKKLVKRKEFERFISENIEI